VKPLSAAYDNTQTTECQVCACGCGEPLRRGTTRRFKRGHYRFIANQHVVDPETGCWVWTGKSNSRGYGLTRDDRGVTAHAHRLYFEAEYGPIPEGQLVVQTCGNRLCCNPTHMELRDAGTEQSARCRERWARQRANPEVRIIGRPAAKRDPEVRAQLERDVAASAGRECRDNPGSAGGSLLSPETAQTPCEPAVTGGLA